jgi:hypothetical protein
MLRCQTGSSSLIEKNAPQTVAPNVRFCVTVSVILAKPIAAHTVETAPVSPFCIHIFLSLLTIDCGTRLVRLRDIMAILRVKIGGAVGGVSRDLQKQIGHK